MKSPQEIFDLLATLSAFLVLSVQYWLSPQASPQTVILVYMLTMAIRVAWDGWKTPAALCTPRNVFWVSLIYIVLLNPALGSELLRTFPPAAVTKAAWLVLLFTLCVLIGSTVRFPTPGSSRLLRALPVVPGRVWLIGIWCVVGAELVRRLFFVEWSWSDMVSDQLKGRSGEVRFGRKQFGDWRVVLEPVAILWSWIPFLVAGYWLKERDQAKWTLALIPAAACLVSAFFGGGRANIVVPLGGLALVVILRVSARAGRTVMVVGAVSLFFIAPLLDAMQRYRSVGWHSGWELESLYMNPLDAKRDSNFEALTRLVDVVPRQQSFRSPAELYYFLAIAPVPRFLWPDKPWMSQDYLGQARDYFASMSCVGDFYFYGGVYHVIAGGVLFGVVFSWLSRFWLLQRRHVEYSMIYVFLVLSVGEALRALWNLTFSALVFVIMIAFMKGLSLLLPRRLQEVPAIDPAPVEAHQD